MSDFLGRHREVSLLSERLAHARSGAPAFLLVEGEPGIGKTALLRQFVTAALGGQDGVHVLDASGDESESSLAYGVVDQLARSARAPLPDELKAVCERSTPAPQPVAVGMGLLELARACAEEAVVAIVVDDLHWADIPSQLALLFALRRLQADRVLALLAARDGAGTAVVRGLRELVTGDHGALIRLEGLSPREIGEIGASLTSRGLSSRTVAHLREHTGGNPLHVRELLEQHPPDTLPAACGTPWPAPASFSKPLLERLKACPAEAQRLVAAAAVAGMACPLSPAHRLAGVEEPLAALEAAVDRHLVAWRHVDGKQMVTFSHPLGRAAVYHALGVAERARLHLRAAQLVADEEVALRHRIAAACEEDDELATAIAAFAAREAAAGSWASAGALYTQAGRLASCGRSREHYLLDAVECLLTGGDAATAAELTDVVASSAGGARPHYLLGRLAYCAGRPVEAEQHLLRAWDRCVAHEESELATKISTELSYLSMTCLRPGEVVMWAQRAVSTAGTTTLATRPLVPLAVGLALTGRVDEALDTLGSIPRSAGHPDREGASLLLARATAHLAADLLASATADAAEVIRLTRKPGPLLHHAGGLWVLSLANYRMGAWDDAILYAERGVSLARDAGFAVVLPALHSAVAAPLAARGAWAAAGEHVAQAASTAGGAMDEAMAAMAHAALARARGDNEAVLQAVQPLRRFGPGRGVGEPGGYWPWQELSVDALIGLRRLDQAEEELGTFEALAAERGRASARCAAARLRGRLEAARGCRGQAGAAFNVALEQASKVPIPFERALVQASYGAFLRRLGKRAAAVGQLAAARDCFSRLGARPFLEQCERELAACGVAAHEGRRDARTPLTPQESAVAQLVLRGLTNREVASGMVVSVNTVEYHLKNIYVKLGVGSRTQLMAQLGPTSPAGAPKRPPGATPLRRGSPGKPRHVPGS